MTVSDLDQTDFDILNCLQEDATLTIKELSFKIHKSNSTVFQRVSRLKRQGFITGSMTLINREKFEGIWITFTLVQLNDHFGGSLEEFKKEVIKFPEVKECYHTTGKYDFLLKVVVNDVKTYKEFITEKLTKLKNVSALQSSFVVDEPKRDLSYPIGKNPKRY